MAERVDFYVLATSGDQARWEFACRLAEKAYKLGNRVLLTVETEGAATQLDELLWTFRPESFVPHEILGPSVNRSAIDHLAIQSPSSSSTALAPVAISVGEPPQGAFDLVINLAPHRIAQLDAVARLAEIVVQDPQVLLTTRQQFSYYKSQGLPVHTHKL